ncbi:MAG: carboxymuconolactone decarboxylase family protein [Caldilinea sp. CFX5]|nr:carboxymuconolactone decarboxylase family protein [Caldilinea sp. CFX5]
MTRISTPQPATMSEAQRRVYDAIVASRGSAAGPFAVWLYSPELADRAQALGEFVRYRTTLAPHLSELAILVTARHHDCQLEWSIHEPFARKAGLTTPIIDAIRAHQEPPHMAADERCVFYFARQLLTQKFVDDATYQSVVGEFGEQGVVELTVLLGYYSLVAMTINVFQLPLPVGMTPLLDG